VLLILLAACVLVGGLLALHTFINSPVTAWACLLLLFFMTQATTLFGGMAGGVNVYPGDLLTVLLLAAGIVRIAPIIARSGLSALLTLLFMLLVVFSMIRGIPEAGLSAINASRPYLAISSAILYFSTFLADDTRLKKYIDLFLWYCGALVLLAVIRYAGLGGGFIAPSPDFRPLPAAGANAIAVGFLICLCRRHYYASSRLVSLLTPIFGAMAIVLQHRTVWVVLIAMMVSAFVVDLGLVKKLIPVLVVGALLSGVLGAVIFGSKVNDQFETSATNQGTFEWRVQGWMALLQSDEQTPLTYAVGLPAGAKFAQTDVLATASGHSEYISALSHVGVLGLCVFLCIVLRAAAKLYGLRRMEGILAFPGPVFWAIFLISVLAYGFTYTITWDQAALIGMANSIVITRRSAKLTEQKCFI
jgi:hypothetical protein